MNKFLVLEKGNNEYPNVIGEFEDIFDALQFANLAYAGIKNTDNCITIEEWGSNSDEIRRIRVITFNKNSISSVYL